MSASSPPLRPKYIAWSENFFTRAAYSLSKDAGQLRGELQDLHARLGKLLDSEAKLKVKWHRCAPKRAPECEVCRDPDARGHPRYLYAWIPKGAGGGGRYMLIKESDAQRDARLRDWEREFLAERARLSIAELERLRDAGELEPGLTAADLEAARQRILAAIHG